MRSCGLFAWLLEIAQISTSQLTLNVEDRRADWHSGKNTLAVLIGDEMSGKLQFYFTLGGYASVVMLGRWGMAKVRGICESLFFHV